MPKNARNSKRSPDIAQNRGTLAAKENQYTNKLVIKGALPAAILWEAYENGEVNKYGVAKKIYPDKNPKKRPTRSVQYQIDKLVERKILKLNRRKPFEDSSNRDKKLYALTPEFKEYMEKTAVNPWKRAMKDLAQNPRILQFSAHVVNSIRVEEKTIEEIQRELDFQNRFPVEFALRLFSPFIKQRFERGELLHTVVKDLPIIWADGGGYDMESEGEAGEKPQYKTMVKFRTDNGKIREEYPGIKLSNERIELKIHELVLPNGTKRYTHMPKLDYSWLLYKGSCQVDENGNRISRLNHTPEKCRGCKAKKEPIKIIKNWKVEGSDSIKVSENNEVKDRSFICQRGANRAVADISLFLEKGTERSVYVFWKCPEGRCDPEISGGLCFANQAD